MNIYNKSAIIEFGKKHANARKQLVLWYNDVLTKVWKTPNEVKKDFITASIINQSRVVFNIKGNDFRLVADINYSKQWLFIKFIGTHKAYDAIDAATVDVYRKSKNSSKKVKTKKK